MSKGAYINEEGTLVVDMAEAEKFWNSMNMEQKYNAMGAMFDPLLAAATQQADRIEELEAKLEKAVARAEVAEATIASVADDGLDKAIDASRTLIAKMKDRTDDQWRRG